MKLPALFLAGVLFGSLNVSAEVKITPERPEAPTASFKFANVSSPRRTDAFAKATITIVDGERDRNGGDVTVLHDGRLPRTADDPKTNFFFRAGTNGGRLAADLGGAIELKEVNTYSWHATTRGPQAYRLYGSDGKAEGFVAHPKRPTDPVTVGWKLIASVDTRAASDEPGGQFAANISDTTSSLGRYQYLLFDVSPTESSDAFGNTFFSEIDVVDKNAPAVSEEPVAEPIVKSVEIEDGIRFSIETTEAPDLTEWANKELLPVVQKWYPKIVAMLPSEGFSAPRTFSLNFTNEYKGVAATMGNRVVCAPPWFRQQLKGEAIGAVVHELVHVVQQYGRARRSGGTRAPGWLVEGLCDYIRWYLFEPESKGAEIRPRNVAAARYDASYRVTANFLNFVVNKYDKDLIKELNAAMREGRYSAEIWKTRTGKPVEELADEWKKSLAEVPTAERN